MLHIKNTNTKNFISNNLSVSLYLSFYLSTHLSLFSHISIYPFISLSNQCIYLSIRISLSSISRYKSSFLISLFFVQGIPLSNFLPGMQVTLMRNPSFEDMVVSYATIPGFVAYRNNVKGSWFVQSFCKVSDNYF